VYRGNTPFFILPLLLWLGVTTACLPPDPEDLDSADFIESLVILSPPGEGYPDPEILQDESLMTFQTGDGKIWLARLDPRTGTFVSPWGREQLIDTGGAPLSVTHNGPEFGINTAGWRLYYARGTAFYSQVWEAWISGDSVRTRPLTSGPVHNNQLATQNANSPEPLQILCVRKDDGRENIVYFSTSDPSSEKWVTVHDQQNIPVRWARGGRYICLRTEAGQLSLLDTRHHIQTPVSRDAGSKTDPNAWSAPDYGNDMLMAAVLDHRAVAVYRDTGHPFWDRISTLTIPADCNRDRMSSPEPFLFRGKSYLSLTIKDSGDGPAEIWIMGVNGKYRERCGDEMIRRRADPEVYIGNNHVFVYYYLVPSLELRRWKSRLTD